MSATERVLWGAAGFVLLSVISQLVINKIETGHWVPPRQGA